MLNDENDYFVFVRITILNILMTVAIIIMTMTIRVIIMTIIHIDDKLCVDRKSCLTGKIMNLFNDL